MSISARYLRVLLGGGCFVVSDPRPECGMCIRSRMGFYVYSACWVGVGHCRHMAGSCFKTRVSKPSWGHGVGDIHQLTGLPGLGSFAWTGSAGTFRNETCRARKLICCTCARLWQLQHQTLIPAMISQKDANQRPDDGVHVCAASLVGQVSLAFDLWVSSIWSHGVRW